MKKIVLHIIFFLLGITAFAQHYPHNLPQYYFIKYDENTIENFGDSLLIEGFYDKLDTLIFEG